MDEATASNRFCLLPILPLIYPACYCQVISLRILLCISRINSKLLTLAFKPSNSGLHLTFSAFISFNMTLLTHLVCSHHTSYSLLLKHTKILGFHAFFHTIPSSIERFLFLQDPDEIPSHLQISPLSVWPGVMAHSSVGL